MTEILSGEGEEIRGGGGVSSARESRNREERRAEKVTQ